MCLFLFMKKEEKLYNNDKALLSEIDEQFQLAKRYLDPVHQKMNGQEELYRTYIDKNTYPHSARVFDPRVFRIIETITPRLVANEPTGSFYPRESGDVATAHILKSLINYDWKRADMFYKLTTFVKSMLIFGTAFGINLWDYRETKKKRMTPQNINGNNVWTPSSTEDVTVVDFDGPNFEPLNIYDCFPDPNATSVDNMRWFILRTFKTIKELKHENDTRGMEVYKNLDVLEKAVQDKANKKTDTSDLDYREHRRMMLSTEELIGQDESNPEFVVIRRFTKDRWVDCVPEFNIIIRDIPNPYFHGKLPIVVGVDYPYPGELFGMGEIEPIDRIQRAINAVLNQRLDNVQLVLRSMWKVRKGGGVDLHTLVSSPGNVITTDDMSAIEPIMVPDVTGNTFVGTMNYLTAALQNGSGITDYTMGVNTSANVATDTATGVRLVQQEANAQFKLKIQLFYSMVVEKIANQWKDLRIQFTTEEQKFRIMGKDSVENIMKSTDLAKTSVTGEPIFPGDFDTPARLTISKDKNFAFLTVYPEDIQPSIVGDWDFIATVSSESLTDPIALNESFFEALDRVSTDEWTQGLATQGKQLDYAALTPKVFEKLSIGIEANDVLTDMPQQPQMGTEGQMPPMGQMPMQPPMPPMPSGNTNFVGGM
jgi:hypothetical protein